LSLFQLLLFFIPGVEVVVTALEIAVAVVEVLLLKRLNSEQRQRQDIQKEMPELTGQLHRNNIEL
jgi:hypothetical protein